MTEAPAQEAPALSKNGTEPPAPADEWATFDDLISKAPAFDEFVLTFPDGKQRKFRFEAIPGPDMDALERKCPPTTQQRADGRQYDPVKFAGELLAVVCKRPQLTADQWRGLIASPNWSNGEAGQLFERAYNLCMRHMDLGPTSTG
jgi:hypothetical protein